MVSGNLCKYKVSKMYFSFHFCYVGSSCFSPKTGYSYEPTSVRVKAQSNGYMVDDSNEEKMYGEAPYFFFFIDIQYKASQVYF